MWCLRLGILLPGPLFHAAPRHGLHKLASVQSASTLPKRKFQGLLYPFSVLDPYLDRLALFKCPMACYFMDALIWIVVGP